MAADYEYRTAVTRLRVDESNRRLLERTIDEWRRACDIAVDVAWPDITDPHALQSRAYEPIRKQTELGSQHSILAIRQAESALRSCLEQREERVGPTQPEFTAPTVTYDLRSMTLFEDDTVSLATVEDRVRCELALPADSDGYQYRFLDAKEWQLAESTLTVERDEFRLHLGFKRPSAEPRPAENRTVLGVDLGVENIAVTSTAQFYSGRELVHKCRELSKRCRSLEEVQTRSANLTLARLANQQRRYIEATLHEVSRAIVTEATRYG